MPLAVQLVHTLVVAPYYHVGSFDDDGNYLMAARALADGGWLTSRLPSGARVVSQYLPGYPGLLVPFIWLLGPALWVPRLVSAVSVAVLYPLGWLWLGRNGVAPWCRVAVLGVLAVNPVLATYSSMVMAEAPFLAVLMLALLVLDRCERSGAPSRGAGAAWGSALVVLLAYLIWLKEAAAGLVVGLLLYLLWRRRWAACAAVVVIVGASMVPALVARHDIRGAVLGDRYASDLAGVLHPGLASGLPLRVVENVWSYLQSALRQTIMPVGSPLPSTGPAYYLLCLVGASVPVLVLVGLVAWHRRHPGAVTWALGAYFAETLVYPYINQRRVVLVLPILAAWYVTGAVAAGRWARHALAAAAALPAARRWAGALAGVLPGLAAAAVVVATAPTATAFDRDYMYKQGVQSPIFAGSPAMSLLAALGTPAGVVETDYRGSVALFSGHRTAWLAFAATAVRSPVPGQGRCTVGTVSAYMRADRARWLLLGAVNQPGHIDSRCLMSLASDPATAARLGTVRLLSTAVDEESVFELIGPSSAQPRLVDPTAFSRPAGAASVTLAPNGQHDAGGTAYLRASRHGRAVFQWRWPAALALSQVSVGSVASTARVGDVSVSVLTDSGGGRRWRVVGRAHGPVGDGGVVPYLLARPAPGLRVLGLRVSVATTGTAQVAYVNAIGVRPSLGQR